ncbi:hypothetical protein CLOP_g14706 [Closterium sp. NIES-67]|nr:hypothetical protein CLOP_g14706 [Closterium sp. NIES-67]
MPSPACGASGAGSAAEADAADRRSAGARGDGGRLRLARERGDAEDVMGEGDAREAQAGSEAVIHDRAGRGDRDDRDYSDGIVMVVREGGDGAVREGEEERDREGGAGDELSTIDPEGRREEAGCALWDLAASEEHAELMVGNHVLEVVLSVLASPASSPRLKEICMGLLANLACHVAPAHSMAAAGGDTAHAMMHAVLAVLMGEDDPPCLTETCRLLATVLRGADSEAWANVLASSAPDSLPRVLWIAANTLHPQLLRKCTDLLLAMADSSHPASRVLLPPLLALPLLPTLSDLIASEMDRLEEGSRDEDDILDSLLQVPEAISLAPGAPSSLLASHPRILPLAVAIVASSPSHALPASAVTAAVLVANIIAEDSSLIPHLIAAPQFVPRLLALLPAVSDDPGARTAIWSLLHALCSHALRGGPQGRAHQSQQQQACDAEEAGGGDITERETAAAAAAAVVVSAVVGEYERIVEDLEEHEGEEDAVCVGEGEENGGDKGARGGEEERNGHVGGGNGTAGDGDVDMGEAGMGGEKRTGGGVNGGCGGGSPHGHIKGPKATLLLLIRLIQQATSLPSSIPNHGPPSMAAAPSAPEAQEVDAAQGDLNSSAAAAAPPPSQAHARSMMLECDPPLSTLHTHSRVDLIRARAAVAALEESIGLREVL